MNDGTFDPRLVNAVADMLRSMTLGGQPVFSHVYTERVGDYIHVDMDGVAGELMFRVAGADHAEVGVPVQPLEDMEMYRVSAHKLGLAPVPPAPAENRWPVSWKPVTDYFTGMNVLVEGQGITVDELNRLNAGIMAIAESVPIDDTDAA